MRYYNLCGYKVSSVVQGCMRLGEKTEKELDELIKTDVECGINFFDHADIYGGGNCEEVFGKFLEKNKSFRDNIIIQTKCGIKKGEYDFSKEHIIESVEGSLKRLKTDHVDFLLLHRPDILCEPEEVAIALDKLEKEGKALHFGVSNHSPMQIELLKKYVKQDLIINQLQFSPTNTTMLKSGVNVNMENEAAVDRDGSILDYCRLKDILIQPWSPFQYGFFDGSYIGSEKFKELNVALEKAAAKYFVTSTGAAIAWILRQPAKMQPVIGTTNIERIKDICIASEIDLTRNEWYEIYRSAGNKLP